ncbi:MAG: OadG family protein [Clostridia bacterium]|nr:OadG family protein [Clostridia bacterium]
MGNQVVDAGSNISNELAIGIGLGTVFVGLICLILICYIMGSLVRAFTKGDKKATPTQTAQTPVAQAQVPVANKGEFAAAIACAIAEDLGTDVTGIRIKSVKKL